MPRLPLALAVLPLLTLLSLAFSMALGPEGGRLVYARVWGGPAAAQLSVRVQVIEEKGGLARGLPDLPISVEARAGPRTSVRTVRTLADGFVDIAVPVEAPSAPLTLELRRVGKAALPLARGLVAPSRHAWFARATRVSGVVPADTASGMPIDLRFEPPVWSVPFAAEVVLELTPGHEQALDVHAEGLGMRLSSAADFRLEAGKPHRLRVLPFVHAAGLVLTARSPGSIGSRSVTLPIRAGSLTAHAEGDALVVESPVQRSRAYYAVVSPAGRLDGGVVLLEPRADGTAAGRLARGDLPPGGDRYLVLSSSADTRFAQVVGLPLDGQGGTFDAHDLLLLDGRHGALGALRAQQARLRWALLAYAGLGAILCVVLFVWHIRRANERLRVELADVGAAPQARDRSSFGLVSATLSLVFAFGLALTWILVR